MSRFCSQPQTILKSTFKFHFLHHKIIRMHCKRLVLCLFLSLILVLCVELVAAVDNSEGNLREVGRCVSSCCVVNFSGLIFNINPLQVVEEDVDLREDAKLNISNDSRETSEPNEHKGDIGADIPPTITHPTPATPESPATLSTPRTSLKTPESVRQTSDLKEDSRNTKPASGSGSYYGSNEGHADQFTKPAPTHAKRSPAKPKGRMGGQPLSGTQDLEDRLYRELRQSRKVADTELAENTARTSRFRIARKHAYPVEHVLEVYNDPNTNLYDVLGVRDTISDSELSKVYRSRTKDVHPGKLS